METPNLEDDDVDRYTLKEAIHEAKRRDIDIRGLKHLFEIKSRLKSRLLKNRIPRSHIFASMDEKAEHDRLKVDLKEIYDCTIDLMKKSVEEKNPFVDKISQFYPDFLSQLYSQQSKLDEKAIKCPILVLGETGAGKSSFINLFLGEEVLPCSLLSNTKVICEILYDEQCWALMYYRGKDKHPKKIVADNKPTFFQELAECIQAKETDGNHCKFVRASIYLPCDILKSGIIIVDSPGVGDTEEMKSLVLDYLMQASSYVYMINSANAGGVQPDRIQELVKEVAQRLLKENREYRPDCALHVCNKWDQIPVPQRKEVLEDTKKKLRKAYKTEEELKIFCISTKEASYIQKEGYVVGQFGSIIKEIYRLIPICREMFLQNSARFLANFLDRCCNCVDSHVHSVLENVEDRENHVKQELLNFSKLEEEIVSFFKRHKKGLKNKIEHVAKQLSAHLKEKEIVDKICSSRGFGIQTGQHWHEVDDNGRVKLININRPKHLPASVFPTDDDVPHDIILQFVHYAAEIIQAPNTCLYEAKHDMYAVGIMMFELMSNGCRAFQQELHKTKSVHNMETFSRFLEKEKVHLPERSHGDLGTDWKETMTRCLNMEITAKQWVDSN